MNLLFRCAPQPRPVRSGHDERRDLTIAESRLSCGRQSQDARRHRPRRTAHLSASRRAHHLHRVSAPCCRRPSVLTQSSILLSNLRRAPSPKTKASTPRGRVRCQTSSPESPQASVISLNSKIGSPRPIFHTSSMRDNTMRNHSSLASSSAITSSGESLRSNSVTAASSFPHVSRMSRCPESRCDPLCALAAVSLYANAGGTRPRCHPNSRSMKRRACKSGRSRARNSRPSIGVRERLSSRNASPSFM